MKRSYTATDLMIYVDTGEGVEIYNRTTVKKPSKAAAKYLLGLEEIDGEVLKVVPGNSREIAIDVDDDFLLSIVGYGKVCE